MNATRKWVAALACALTIGAQGAYAAGPYAYVTAFDSNSVTVIDSASHTVIASVPVGINPVGVAATPDGRFVYVTNAGADSVSVIDTSSNTVVAAVPVGTTPIGIAVTPDGRLAYATMLGDGSVYAIETATNTVAFTIALDASAPFDIAIAPDGRVAYVTNSGASSVIALDTATSNVLGSVPVGAFPYGAAVTPDGRFAYVANLAGGAAESVSVIDTASNAVSSVALEAGASDVAIGPDGRFAYVVHGSTNRVAVVDTATNSRVAAVQVGANPARIAVSPDGRFAYVANTDAGTVSVIDTATNSVLATVEVGPAPQNVAFASLKPQDTTAPATAASAAPGANAAGWSNAPVTVTLSATDEQDGSGVKSIAYTLAGATSGGGQAAGATASFMVSAEGLTTVGYGATDNAGNAETPKSLALRIDLTAPASAASVTPPADSSGSHHGPVTVNVAATDGGSGVQSISILRGSGSETFPGASAAVIVSTPGETTLTYRATDTAGNVEPAKTLTIRIEAAAPALSAKVSVHPPVLWPPDRRLDAVHAHFKVANAVGRTRVKAVSVASDEPVGHTSPDWIVKGSSVKLRAERSDRGDGRVYTITYTLVDEAGNTAQASDTVSVPKYLGWRWNRHYSRWDRD